MAKKAETKYKEKVLAFLKKLPRCEAEKIQQVGKCGTLDIWCTINSFSVLIELKKSKDDKLSSIQKLKGYRHKKAGAFVFQMYPENHKEICSKLIAIHNFKHLDTVKLI